MAVLLSLAALIALPVCMGGGALHAMNINRYDNRCGTFRTTYREQVLTFIERAEQRGTEGLVSAGQLVRRMETRQQPPPARSRQAGKGPLTGPPPSRHAGIPLRREWASPLRVACKVWLPVQLQCFCWAWPRLLS